MNRPISRKPTSVDFAYGQLKQRVLDNEFAPGSQHLEQELAELLSLSRTPVREALQRLEGEGLVEIIPRRGVRVVPLSGKDMHDISVILSGLEAAAARLNAERGLDDSQIQQLMHLLEEMECALDEDRLVDWAHADERFHKLLVQFTDNSRLIEMVGQLWDQSHRARMATLTLRPKPLKSNQDHRAVVEAIMQRDAERAWRVHSDHRRKSASMLVGLLQEFGLKNL